MVDAFGNELVVGVRAWLPAGTYLDALVGRSRSILFSPTVAPRRRLELIAELVLRPPSTQVLAQVA